jgi:hypothetical protein
MKQINTSGVNIMIDKNELNDSENTNAVKDPDNWTTGDEKMTGAQASYLQTLCEQANVDFDENLTKAEASKRIDELQKKTGRGTDNERSKTQSN